MTTDRDREYAAWLADLWNVATRPDAPMPADTPERRDLWRMLADLPSEQETRDFAVVPAPDDDGD